MIEARAYAERALQILDALAGSSESWATHLILADIAEQEGRWEAAHNHRRSGRERFAAFAGNIQRIDQTFGNFIQASAAAKRGDVKARATVEAILPQLEANGWHITSAIHHIWAGEHDWHALAEDLGYEESLLVLCVLKAIEEMK